jgi:hypothetical protein
MEIETDVAVYSRLIYRKSAVHVLKFLNPENVFYRNMLQEEMDLLGRHEILDVVGTLLKVCESFLEI